MRLIIRGHVLILGTIYLEVITFMKLSVIIPVFNEAETIKELVDRVRKVPLEKEILLVDDASTDGSG